MLLGLRTVGATRIAAICALASSHCLLLSDLDGLTGDGGAHDSSASQGGGAATTMGHGGGSSSSTGGGAGSAGTAGGAGGPGGTGGSGGGGLAFPGTGVLDDFNRADGKVGAGWVQGDSSLFTIADDELTTGAEDEPDAILFSDSFGPDQEVFVTLKSFTENDIEIELLLKSQTTSSEDDAIQVSYNRFGTTNRLEVYTSDSAGGTSSMLGGMKLTLQPGDQLGARAFADGRVEVYVNKEIVASWSAISWAYHGDGGRIGIYGSGLGDPVIFDDFGGGTLP